MENTDAIDVLMITKDNCKHKGKKFFIQCLNQLINTIKIHHLIVVDGESTDETIPIIKGMNLPNLILLSDKGEGIGRAWTIGAQHVDTPMFMHFDADVFVHEDWQKITRKYMRGNIGIVSARMGSISDGPGGQFDKTMISLRRRILKAPPRKTMGHTGSALFLTKAIKGIRIPAERFRWAQDWYVVGFVKKRGYEVTTTEEIVATHMHEHMNYAGRAYTHGGLLRVNYFKRLRTLVANVIKSIPKGIYAFLLTGNHKMFFFQFVWDWNILRGYLKWNHSTKAVVSDRKVPIE